MTEQQLPHPQVDALMALAEDYARAWGHDTTEFFVIKNQAQKAKSALRTALEAALPSGREPRHCQSAALGVALAAQPRGEIMSDMERGMAEVARRLSEVQAERDALQALINTPELDSFLRAVHIEAVHQVERWGTAHDRAKRPADWFWLVGYLGGKALHAAIAGDADKARHHCISTAAALYNWHSAISGRDTRMCPGRSDLAEVVDAAFPGEATPGLATPAPALTRADAVRIAQEVGMLGDVVLNGPALVRFAERVRALGVQAPDGEQR